MKLDMRGLDRNLDQVVSYRPRKDIRQQELPRSNRSNSPFRYPGGKFYARKLILDEIPDHDFYCEPFAGSASIFFVKLKSEYSLLNDLDGDVINTLCQIRDRVEEVIKLMKDVSANKKLHNYYKNKYIPKSKLQHVFRWFYLNRTSYSGIMRTENCYWGYGEKYSMRPENWPPHLRTVSDRLQSVGLASEDFEKSIDRLQARSNYGSSEFSNAVHAINRGDMDLAGLKKRLHHWMSFTFAYEHEHYFGIDDFHLLLQKKFENGQGYYGWSGLRYFLYEYELGLLSGSRHKKVDWADLLKSPKDKISIEHIFPQSETAAWKPAFKGIREREREAYRNSLGNLLLLSSAINSSLQNDAFAEKKKPKYNRDGSKIRNGYADDSHSEIEVSNYKDWGPDEIRERGIQLLKFMEKRWNIRFADDKAREKLLFIGTVDGEKPNGEASE